MASVGGASLLLPVVMLWAKSVPKSARASASATVRRWPIQSSVLIPHWREM